MAKKGQKAIYCEKCGAVANSTKKDLNGIDCFRPGCNGKMQRR